MEIIRAREFCRQSWPQIFERNNVAAPLQFEECRFVEVDFSNADLSAHKFVNCALEDVLLRETVLEDAAWTGAAFVGCER